MPHSPMGLCINTLTDTNLVVNERPETFPESVLDKLLQEMTTM